MRTFLHSEAGFSLAEMLVATAILLIISSAVTSGLLGLTNSQKTISNRVDMHAGIRSATELLQQEVGQAGRIAVPGTATLNGTIGAAGAATVGITQTVNGVASPSVAGLFVGELLDIDAGTANQETVAISVVNTASNQITATFANPHLNLNTPANVYGGFASGIVPPQPGYANGSTGSVLKLYGDINGDGNMVYVEYTCDPLPGGTGNFYRNVVSYDAVAKPAVTASLALLTNIQTNPGGTACFTYMPNPLPVVSGNTFVLDVAVTLTVQTQSVDPITKQYQTETKALLNVSPRNVFDVWQFATAGITTRVQPIPPSVTTLLP
jgi:prepilin-type N-terminal cleavage/methylation domain-containing protein